MKKNRLIVIVSLIAICVFSILFLQQYIGGKIIAGIRKEKVWTSSSNCYLRQKYYDDGGLFSEQFYRKDRKGREMLVGYYKEFYPDSNIKAYIVYKIADSTKDTITYNESGTLYYENGIIKRQFNKCAGKYVGVQKTFFQSGKIAAVSINEPSGRECFFLQKDMSGATKKMTGIPFSVVCEKTVRANDSLKTSYTVIETDDLHSRLVTLVKDSKGKTIFNRNASQFDPFIHGDKYFDAYTFTQPGKYNFTYFVELFYDKKLITKAVLTDTIAVTE